MLSWERLHAEHQHPKTSAGRAINPPDPIPAGGRTRAARGVLWLSVGSWGSKGAQTVVLLVLARALAPSKFGILAIAALTYNILSALNELGVSDALVYRKDRIAEASRTALSMVLVSGLVLLGVTWVLAPVIASFFHTSAATFVVRGFAVCLPLDAAAAVPIGRLTRSLGFSRRAVTDTLPSLIGAGVTIGVAVSGHPLIGLVAGQIAGSTANLVVAMLVGPACLPGWNTDLARQILAYGGYLSAANLVNLGLLNVDYIIVGHVLGPVALGYYSLAYRIAFMPYLSVAFVVNGAAFPYYCRLPSREAIGRTAENVFGLINALSIPWFAGLVLFASDITLLGHKWAPATGALRFLAVYGLFLSVILSSLQVLKAVGRSDLVLFGRGLHLAILTVVVIGTVHGGITVVALDQALVAGAVAALVGMWIVRHGSVGLTGLARSVGLPALGVVGMVAVVLLLGRIPGLHVASSMKSLLILGPLALAVFVVILLGVMGEPLRNAWVALRGGSEEAPIDVQRAAGSEGDGTTWTRERTLISQVGVDGRLSALDGENRARGTHDVKKTEPVSYRLSHLGPEKARAYDDDLWDPRAAKGLDWLVEQQLLADVLRSRVPSGPQAAADFACGTGRVLEFLSRYYASPVGIDVSPDMLALARDRCPRATVVLGDVTTIPALAPGPFDLITAFRFFLNAEPDLRSSALSWMQGALRPGGLVVANFHLNPVSLRGTYLRLRMQPATRPSMMTSEEARQLFLAHGFTVQRILGYSFLPYRRDGRKLLAPAARRAVETSLAGTDFFRPIAGNFLLVAELAPSGPPDLQMTTGGS
jgi:O-antigen/teichoic acid export membrane protein/SAM-dependent methyltransferase